VAPNTASVWKIGKKDQIFRINEYAKTNYYKFFIQALQLFAKIDSLFCKKKGDDNTQKAATIL